MEYSVFITRIEYKGTTLTVEANTKEEAEAKAQELSAQFNWQYANTISTHEDCHAINTNDLENES